MNKTTTITGVIITIIIIGGLIFYANQKPIPPIEQTKTPQTTYTNSDQTKQAGLPTATTNSSVSSTDTTAVLNGTVIPQGSFTSYWYEYGTSSNLENKSSSQKQMIGSGFTSITAPGYITGLTKNTIYFFRIIAENSFGQVTGSQHSFQTTFGNPPPTGNAPVMKTLTATGVSKTTAKLHGEVNPNGAPTQFWFEYGQNPNLGNTTAFETIGNGTIKLPVSISLSNLSPGTMYYFRLNAQNQFGTITGEILNFKTDNPPSATAPSVSTKNATNISTSTAMLKGTVNSNGAETLYWFEYSVSPAFTSLLSYSTEKKSSGAGLENTSVEGNIINLNSKTNYYFRLIAQNNMGLVKGEPVTFKTK